MTKTCEGPPRDGSASGPKGVCFGGEQFPDTAPAQKNQAQNVVRLVPRSPTPRSRHRYEVRIAVAAARTPVARSRVFRLSESDVELLIAAATRLEARVS
jgi:hypothetical protein